MILGHAAAGLGEEEAQAMAAGWKAKGLDTWWGQRGRDPEAPDGWGAAWGRVLGATPHIDGVPGDPGPFAWGGGIADYPGATHHVALSRQAFEAVLSEASNMLAAAGIAEPPRLHLLHIIEYEHESYLDAKPFGRPAGPPPEIEQQGLRLVDQLVKLEWLELEPGAGVFTAVIFVATPQLSCGSAVCRDFFNAGGVNPGGYGNNASLVCSGR